PTWHALLCQTGGLDRPPSARWISSVFDLDCSCADLKSGPGSVGNNVRRSIVLYRFTPLIEPGDFGNAFLMRLFLDLAELLKHYVLVSASKVYGVPYALRAHVNRRFDTAYLCRYGFSFDQAGLAVEFDNQWDLAAVVFFRYYFVQHVSDASFVGCSIFN